MLARLSQVARHLGATATPSTRPALSKMASASAAASERGRRTIQTAACLIIGDEVLGGKVRCDGELICIDENWLADE